jgi:unsaturated rhamnogalacturonyl hydrolase
MASGRLGITLTLFTALAAAPITAIPLLAQGGIPASERIPQVGDDPTNPGPLATDLSPALKPADVKLAIKRVADWQLAKVASTPSHDWTFATLYAGFISASTTLKDPRYANEVQHIGEQFNWSLGKRQTHADDQAIGQSYVALYRLNHDPARIAPMREQFDRVMLLPDDPAKPLWWWCDALFMAPPAWAGLSTITGDPKYTTYMDHEWHITSDLLWDKDENLFFRDATYFAKREKNGKKIFWSRGNGWVMGGLARTIDELPANDPRRAFYIDKFKLMAEKIASLQGDNGLWGPGLLDAADYPLPENSGSAFFVYAFAWGINHHILDQKKYGPALAKGWKGLVSHIYQDGRLGCIQPIGAAPGAYVPGSSYVFGTGAFLLAGSEVEIYSRTHKH